ncbi:MAG: hypothetical protein WKF75_07290 [Singulisphaera sp.]
MAAGGEIRTKASLGVASVRSWLRKGDPADRADLDEPISGRWPTMRSLAPSGW